MQKRRFKILVHFPRKARDVQKQPVFGRGISGGICLKRAHETPKFPAFSGRRVQIGADKLRPIP
jgi:hypothetical protein